MLIWVHNIKKWTEWFNFVGQDGLDYDKSAKTHKFYISAWLVQSGHPMSDTNYHHRT